jgi:hypothetical protein
LKAPQCAPGSRSDLTIGRPAEKAQIVESLLGAGRFIDGVESTDLEVEVQRRFIEVQPPARRIVLDRLP